jgi:hypothetical protein
LRAAKQRGNLKMCCFYTGPPRFTRLDREKNLAGET